MHVHLVLCYRLCCDNWIVYSTHVVCIFSVWNSVVLIQLGHFVKMVNKLFLVLAVSFVASEDTKCDPFPFGTNILNVVVAAIIGTILPNSCPCSYPCSVQGVKEHVQFFYTKR